MILRFRFLTYNKSTFVVQYNNPQQIHNQSNVECNIDCMAKGAFCKLKNLLTGNDNEEKTIERLRVLGVKI